MIGRLIWVVIWESTYSFVYRWSSNTKFIGYKWTQNLLCKLLFIQCNTKPLSMCVRTYVSYTTYLVHYNAVLCHTYFCVPEAFSFLSIVVFTHSIPLWTWMEISWIQRQNFSTRNLYDINRTLDSSSILVFEYDGV